jgi:hypothetical protein
MSKKNRTATASKISSKRVSRSAATGRFVHKSTALTRPASQHVVYTENGWSVRKSNASRAGRVFDTQKEAVGYAKDVAQREGADLYIHRADGTIREKDSYGSQPSSRKH